MVLLLPVLGFAQVYKCATPWGGVEYSQKPCEGGEKLKVQKAPPSSTDLVEQYRESLKAVNDSWDARCKGRDVPVLKIGMLLMDVMCVSSCPGFQTR